MNKNISDLTVIIQDRERHKEIIEEVRRVGARIKLFSEGGDVAAAIATAFEDTGVDILMGIGGGAPEGGVIAAAALKCMGGDFQGKLYPMSEKERVRCANMGWTEDKLDKLLTMDDLAKGNDIFFAATGISDGGIF